METRNRWTDEEDEILVQAIKANPHNKTEAFRAAAEKVNHSEKCCSGRWYKVLSNQEHKKYVGCMFTTIGIESRLDNRTINSYKSYIKPVKSKKGMWAKVKALLNINK